MLRIFICVVLLYLPYSTKYKYIRGVTLNAGWLQLNLPLVPCRQMKDQSKKVASLKHKEQVEKSKNARLMEEARKREDNLSENSQQVKVSCSSSSSGWGSPLTPLKKNNSRSLIFLAPSRLLLVQDSLRQKAERIEELEEALRESVQITAEREMVLAQEEAARSVQEKQVGLFDAMACNM